MPITAIVQGKKVISLDLSDEDWESVKRADIRMDCCGSVGHTRTSVLGLRHFYHAKNSDCPFIDQEGESDEHRRLKYLVFQACEKFGWKADIEHRMDGLIADVLAEKDDKKVAFEVQLSPQTYEVTVSRTNAFKKENIQCYWLFRQIPNVIYGSTDIYMNEVIGDKKPKCNINGEIVALSEFVERALSNLVCAPTILTKVTKKEETKHDSNPGVSDIADAKRYRSSFTELEEAAKKEAPPINWSEADRRRAIGILEYQQDKMKRMDDDHLQYDLRSWDIIGSYSTLEIASTMRQRAWLYYHCTYIIIDDGKYIVIAENKKSYKQQPGLQAIRNT